MLKKLHQRLNCLKLDVSPLKEKLGNDVLNKASVTWEKTMLRTTCSLLLKFARRSFDMVLISFRIWGEHCMHLLFSIPNV